MRSVSLAAPSRLPIRMKSGAATSGNEFIACAIFCGTIDPDRPPSKTNANAANPIAAKSGSPSRMTTSQTPTISSINCVMDAGSFDADLDGCGCGGLRPLQRLYHLACTLRGRDDARQHHGHVH